MLPFILMIHHVFVFVINVIYFHPCEYSDINKYNLLSYVLGLKWTVPPQVYVLKDSPQLVALLVSGGNFREWCIAEGNRSLR
jgi:hypothetical protein